MTCYPLETQLDMPPSFFFFFFKDLQYIFLNALSQNCALHRLSLIAGI